MKQIDFNKIVARVVESFKDKDLMRDTGGASKMREREPELRPPREDSKKRYGKRKLKPSERERDTYEDKDIKTSSVMWSQEDKRFTDGLESLFRKRTYSEKVMSNLVDIMMEVRGVSEKSFSEVQKIQDEVRMIFEGNDELRKTVKLWEKDRLRPEFCAEGIFYRLCK